MANAKKNIGVQKRLVCPMLYGNMDGSTRKPPALINLEQVAIGYYIKDATAWITSLIVARVASMNSHLSKWAVWLFCLLLPNFGVSLKAGRLQKRTWYSYPYCCKAPLQDDYIMVTTICK